MISILIHQIHLVLIKTLRVSPSKMSLIHLYSWLKIKCHNNIIVISCFALLPNLLQEISLQIGVATKNLRQLTISLDVESLPNVEQIEMVGRANCIDIGGCSLDPIFGQLEVCVFHFGE
jgi:hypothetical protein